MRWLDRLERIFGRWTIPNFPLFIVAANAVIYFLSQAQPEFTSKLYLEPDALRTGQWWRAVTFLFLPPDMSFFWLLLWLYVLFLYSTALEQEWGEFRFLFFYAVGALATVLTSLWIDAPLFNMALNTTLFLAFARLFPESELLLFFILPVKVKYLGLFAWAMTLWMFITGSMVARAEIAASLFNYFLFFGMGLFQSARLRFEVWKNRRRWPRN